MANAAHVAGFLFGYFFGNVFIARKYVISCRIGLAFLTLLTVLSAVYLPWSESWEMRHGIAQYLNIAEDAEAGNPEAQYLYADFF